MSQTGTNEGLHLRPQTQSVSWCHLSLAFKSFHLGILFPVQVAFVLGTAMTREILLVIILFLIKKIIINFCFPFPYLHSKTGRISHYQCKKMSKHERIMIQLLPVWSVTSVRKSAYINQWIKKIIILSRCLQINTTTTIHLMTRGLQKSERLKFWWFGRGLDYRNRFWFLD